MKPSLRHDHAADVPRLAGHTAAPDGTLPARGVDDDGQCIFCAPEPPVTALALVEDFLTEAGATPTPELLARLDDALDSEGIRRAAEFLHFTLDTLNGSPAAVALKRHLLGPCGETLRSEAKRLGVSHVAIVKAGRRVARRVTTLPRGRAAMNATEL